MERSFNHADFWPFPNQVVSQGRNQLDSPKDDPTIRPSPQDVSMSLEQLRKGQQQLREVQNSGGWWLVDGHPPPEKMMGILYNGYTHYKSNINPILFGLVI